MNNKYLHKIRNLIFVLKIVLLTQCNVSNTTSYDYAKSIAIAKGSFPDSLTAHFPGSISGAFRLVSVGPSKCVEHGRCGISLIAELNDSLEIYLEQIIISNSLINTHFGDSCNLFINPGNTDDVVDCEKLLDSLRLNCSTFNFILPNFPKILNQSKLLIPAEYIDIYEFELFVLSTTAGKFLEAENLTNGCGLPTVWRNGISEGFGIDKENKKVLFWLEMW